MTETIVLGGGCFWCLEAAFIQLRGVSHVVSGYTGGYTENPDYRSVCSGDTGHVEVIQVGFDPAVIDYETLLKAFFTIHDPTTPDRQGHDVGPQYRSAIFSHDAKQQKIAETLVHELEQQKIWPAPVVTTITPIQRFWPAEDYHQAYFARNPEQPYCIAVVAPKARKLREAFAHLMR